VSGASVPLQEIARYLDGYLSVTEVPDDPNALNGLQVENQGTIRRIVAAVDASLATIEATAPVGRSPAGTLLVVHHGLFWDGNRPLTGRRFRRIRALLDRDVALYSAHIPLDVHPEVGNNAILARKLGLEHPVRFGDYRGIPIGVAGSLPGADVSREALCALVERATGNTAGAVRLIPGGSEIVRRVGVITGAAGNMINAAREAGCDTFITGEGAAHTYFDAMEWGLNVIYAGHYATETVGVQALGSHLSERFDLPWEFHDHPTGM
jgi:dinuclear metal center YbgI/SA1388 family protein